MDSESAPPPSKPSWSSLLKHPEQPNQHRPPTAPPPSLIDGCANSSKGVSVAVVDANAIIQGGERLSSLADRFVSLEEVIYEVRDPTSRHRLSVLPFNVETLDPAPEHLKKVINFARATGDLQTLSDVDLRLIALTYTVESQFHGTSHLRDTPPPVHMLSTRRLAEKDMPGWGSNVPNIEEWEALDGIPESNSNQDSKILPLKDLSVNIQSDESLSHHDGPVDSHFLDDNSADKSPRKHRRYPVKKREVNIEGKKMVADGIDASQGQCDDEGGEWCPAVSRSTYRRFVRRKARREVHEASMKDDMPMYSEGNTESKLSCEEDSTEGRSKKAETMGDVNETDDITSIMNQMKIEEYLSKADQEEVLQNSYPQVDASVELDSAACNGGTCLPGEQKDCDGDESDHYIGESISQASEGLDASSVDGNSSEQSWMLRSLSESTVACVTGDFAMQNVILQMGLRLVAPGGMQIRELHRWVLKCHACHKVTTEIGRIFCPKCGNGGTLRKVALTIGENGIVLAAHRPRVSLRGTRFSLPLPQGGRDAITKNPVLREDQLPQRFGIFIREGRSKEKKKPADKDEGCFFASAHVFGHRPDRKEPLKPPVRQALTVFSGKKNPNDNHYSRSKR